MIPGRIRVATATLACLALLPCAASAAMSCAALATLQLPETTIAAAHEVPAGSFTPPGTTTPLSNLPAFCRVALTVAPAIHVEVWLPKSIWNERYQGVGGGTISRLSTGGS